MNFYRQAVNLFRRYHARNPREGEIARIAVTEPEDVLLVGELAAVQYAVAGHEKEYYHKFRKSGRPLLYVSADGSRMYIVKGQWKFTDRGFTP